MLRCGRCFTEQAQFARAENCLGTAANAKFLKDLFVVPFDRTQGEEKLICNLLITQPLGDQTQDLVLALRQLLIIYWSFDIHKRLSPLYFS